MRGLRVASQKWHPNWDWTKREVVDAIDWAGLALSVEYHWMPMIFGV
jgi:hypothetical protein